MFKQILFYIVLAVAAVGLILNINHFLFSFVSMLINLAIIVGIIYLIYYFFFLTEDQRKYKRALRKHKRQNRRR
ncbi:MULTISPECIES: SA1362 family protein [Staphylococcus]|uniref:SA1362 family protein n=1 Tax=Staphylococcus hsinchuensis TaxID=3051183 RepID=A0ABZ3EBH7_9STAP|nr:MULTISPECIES: SA1362 family protein [unclassified Staphylococcus]